jgi:hypothetical protein
VTGELAGLEGGKDAPGPAFRFQMDGDAILLAQGDAAASHSSDGRGLYRPTIDAGQRGPDRLADVDWAGPDVDAGLPAFAPFEALDAGRPELAGLSTPALDLLSQPVPIFDLA